MTKNSQSRAARRKQKKAAKKSIWKKLLLAIVIIFIAVVIGGGAVVTYWIATAPELDASKLADPYPSVFLDKNGEEFAKRGSENREKVEFEELPQVLIDAVIATEDARFFEHAGIDLRRIGGAVVANITDGFGSQGASTITQQVVEKSFLSPEKKISLKVQEAWLALKLERELPKEEILEIYLNKIFYGANAYGVKQAAETYFGKEDLNDLTLPEAAILAGLPQRPTAYNPFENPDLTKERMDTVLTLMVRHDKITEEEANEAREVDITSLLAESRPESRPYDAFIRQVEKEVSEKLDGADINTDGLIIHTTLDTNAQDYIEFLLTDSEENPIQYPNNEFQAAMALIDTKTGAIQALGGGRNQEVGDFNYAIQGGSQPGSTIKPILAYAPAIEYNKMSTYHQLNDDKPYEAPGLSKPIRNATRTYSGWVTARHALAQSLNVPTLKLFEEVGRENAKEFAENLGIEFKKDIALTDAIGGASLNVTPLQLAGAFQAFGNQGVHYEPYAVTKVVYPDGQEVDLRPESEVAMSDYTAYMTTDMLKTAVTQGTGTRANVSGLPLAGKTGTTSFDSGEAKDSWFVGYTTNYTLSVWTGEVGEDNKRLPISDTGISRDLFRYAMSHVSEGIETRDFERPSSVVEVQIEKGSNPPALPSSHTPSSNIITELFVKGTEPTSVSEKYDKLDSVNNLKAEYNEENNLIHLSWDYDSNDDILFEVSASINGGEMKGLSSTDELSLEVTEPESGEYQFQVVAVDKNDADNRSDPATATVVVPESEEELEEEDSNEDEEEEEETGNIPPVDGLSANYVAESGLIDVTWTYNGPPASFEVVVNGEQSQTVQSPGIEISGATPGETYTIQVTPIGLNGANQNQKGDAKQVTVKVPPEEEEEEEEDIPVSEDVNEEETEEDENEQNEEENNE